MEEKIKVLIADDMEMIVKNISDIVIKNNSTQIVGTASDGEEEYQKILEFKPDIVFTDNKMPKMNGIDVIEKISNLTISNKPEFVLITGDRDIELIRKANDLNVLRILNKPIDENKILEILNEYSNIQNEKFETDKIINKKNDSLFNKILSYLKK